MSTQRYLAAINGQTTMVVPNTSSAGATDSGKIVALNSAGQIDATMLASTSGLPSYSVVASAAITAGALVNIYPNAGVLNARPADNTAVGSEANGYAPSAIASGASGTVYLGEGLISGLSALSVGAPYFLGTAGAVTTTAPSTAGNLIQPVGKAVSATEFYIQPSSFTVVVA